MVLELEEVVHQVELLIQDDEFKSAVINWLNAQAQKDRAYAEWRLR